MGQMQKGLDFNQQRKIGFEKLAKIFFGGLDRSLGPAMLLGFKGINGYGHLRRTDHIGHKF